MLGSTKRHPVNIRFSKN